MTASFVGGDAQGANSTSVTVTMPGGIQAGDIALIAHPYSPTVTGGTDPTTPSGWTQLDTEDWSTSYRARLYGKVLTGSETTVNFANGTQKLTSTLGVFRGVTAIHVNGFRLATTVATTHTAASATASVNVVQVAFITERESVPSTAFTPPAGHTMGPAVYMTGGGATCAGLAYNLTTTTGTIGGGTWGEDVANDALIMFVVGLEVPTTGTVARTQANQTSTATGVLGYSGTVARTQAAQTSSATGGLAYTGTVARTEAPDTVTASGSVMAALPPSAPSAANRSPFRIQIYDTSFAKQGEVNSYQSVSFTLRRNAVGEWTILLNPSDQAVVELVKKRRRITVDYKGVRIFSGPVERRRQVRDENGLRLWEFGGPDDMIWLVDRLAFPNPLGTIPGDNIVFTQTVADDIRRGDGETVIKGYVTDNAVTRLPVPGLTVAANLNRGSTTTGSARMIPLLDATAPVASGSGLTMSLKQVSTGLVFDVFAPQAQPVRLSEKLKNLKAWEYIESAPGATRAVVGGRGDGTAKKFLKRTLASSETDWEIREQFLDATDVDTDADLPIKGAEYLGQNAPQAGFLITPEDSDSMSYALTYNLGDDVDVEVADGVFVTDTVEQISLTHGAGGLPTVQPIVGNIDAADKTNAVYRKFGDLLRRIARLERKA